MRELTKQQTSLLLFLETRAVNYLGGVAGTHMNAADFDQAKKWSDEGFIEFGRVASHCIADGVGHWVKLSDEAWALAGAERRARAERGWERRHFETTAERRASVQQTEAP